MEGRRPSARMRLMLAVTGVLWGGAVVGGMTALARYSHTAGPSAEPPARFPEDSALRPTPGRFLLVMLAHPRCPCTRASLAELQEVMERAGPRVDAHVLFLHPERADAAWEEGPLWQRAAAIPGVTVRQDEGGVEAQRFGATTSGHVLLFDAGGHLRFSGGITGSRGHEGNNAGRASVEALVMQEEGRSQHPVYGCALEDPQPLLAGSQRP
ncbi:RedB protein [Stigmatella sp. ncwal1]|uniref:RedB protein n=1 Tax=Stigmatella ashevillensis TaxID=2995309 RepID=A0ABT5DG53_9BACT|nr:RedB protein [Stigmatella ashevillena]MDC0711302.1 RedB protein [Stigmatella ashevillena]